MEFHRVESPHRFESPNRDCQPSRSSSSMQINTGYLTPLYDDRRDSTVSDSSSSYPRSVASDPSSTYCSPQIPQTPTQAQDMMSNSIILGSKPRADRNFIDLYRAPQYDPRVPKLHMASQDGWVPVSRTEANQAVLVSNSNVLDPFPAIIHKSPQQMMMPQTDVYSSSEGWVTPPSSNVTARGGMYPSFDELACSRTNTPYSWSPNVTAVESFSSGSFDKTMGHQEAVFPHDGQVYVRPPSEGYEADFEETGFSSAYPESPLLHAMPQVKPGRHQPNANAQLPYSFTPHFVPRTTLRTPNGIRTIRKEKSLSAISKRRNKPHKNDVTYKMTTHGSSHIEVKLEGKFKKDSTGRWTGTGAESQKHRCDVERGDQICGRTFKRIEHLRRHMKTHTQEQPFACEFPTQKVEDGQVRFDKCGKLFQRNDNCVAHFKTHVSQDKRGFYFPNSNLSKENIEVASNDQLIHFAEQMQSRISTDNRKKGSRNPRVTWEEFIHKLKEIKSEDEVSKIIASVFKSCLKDDEKTRHSSR